MGLVSGIITVHGFSESATGGCAKRRKGRAGAATEQASETGVHPHEFSSGTIAAMSAYSFEFAQPFHSGGP